MTHSTHPLRLAGSALAAALAVVSTSAFAQDAAAPFPATPEPVVVVPEVPVPAAPEPTVVLPVEQPEPAPPADTRAPVPTPEPVAAEPARPRAPAPTSERTAPVVQAEATPPAVADAPPAIVAPIAAPAAAGEPAATVQPGEARDNAGIVALIIGGLLFLALAIWGFVAIGRRRPVRRLVAESTVPVPVRSAPAVETPATVVAAQSSRPVAPRFAPHQQSAAGGLPHTGASVALPRKLPESYAEREALFNRLVDARPDRANPFTDRKARMKRARLIMQSIGRDFSDAEPWIDLSQYPNNWPELADKRSAAA